MLCYISAGAQFVRINLDVPTKYELSEITPLTLTLQTNTESGIPVLKGTAVLSLSAPENVHILATLVVPDSLRDEQGNIIRFKASLAFRNDGKNEPPGTNAGKRAFFQLSDCSRIFKYIKNAPQELNAYLFIHAIMELSQCIKTTYIGILDLNIEYN
jgi:hypothetical protein